MTRSTFDRVARFLVLCAFATCHPSGGGGAQAQPQPCASGVLEWLDRCGRAQNLSIAPHFCPLGLAVVDVTAPGAAVPLRIEISHGDRPAAMHSGPLGLSPVGEFPDWSRVDAPTRRALEGVAACAASTVDVDRFLAALDNPNLPPGPPLRFPWRMLLAGVFGLVAWRQGREAAHPGSTFRRLAPAATLVIATLLIRYSVLEPAFFHQSGHGPGWLESARRTGPPYGPGYVEMLGWIVFVTPQRQEDAAFLANAVLGAFLPLLLFVIARRVGGGDRLAWAIAVVAAVDPMLARVSLSESYFGIGATLLAGAAAALVWAFDRPRALSARSAAVIAAGLLVSQAVRIHPNTWLPAALIPLVILLGAGPWRNRLAGLGFAAVGVALVAGMTAGTELLDVVRGPIGQQWVPGVNHPVVGISLAIAPAVIAILLALLALALPARRQLLLSIAVAGATLAAFLMMRQLAITNNLLVYQLATLSLYAAPLVAAAASAVASLGNRRSTAVAVVVLIVGVGTLPWRWPSMTRLPSDALEARLFVEWRKTLPATAQVWFLCYSDGENFRLPLWAPDAPPAPYAVGHQLRLDEEPRPPQELIDQQLAYYYHSSICSRPDGRHWCDAVEARLELEPVERRELPAVVSGGRPFDSPTLEVALYRVRGFKHREDVPPSL